LGEKRRFFSFKKIVAAAIIFIWPELHFLVSNFYKKLSNIKNKALVVNAMSEEDIASIEQMLALIRYLPIRGE